MNSSSWAMSVARASFVARSDGRTFGRINLTAGSVRPTGCWDSTGYLLFFMYW